VQRRSLSGLWCHRRRRVDNWNLPEERSKVLRARARLSCPVCLVPKPRGPFSRTWLALSTSGAPAAPRLALRAAHAALRSASMESDESDELGERSEMQAICRTIESLLADQRMMP